MCIFLGISLNNILNVSLVYEVRFACYMLYKSDLISPCYFLFVTLFSFLSFVLIALLLLSKKRKKLYNKISLAAYAYKQKHLLHIQFKMKKKYIVRSTKKNRTHLSTLYVMYASCRSITHAQKKTVIQKKTPYDS